MKITLKILKPLEPPKLMSASTHDFDADQSEIQRRCKLALEQGWLSVMVPHWEEKDGAARRGKVLHSFL